MSIRIRTVDGVRVALCAARSVPKEGDVYLDDADHHALGVKFDLDFASEGRVAKSIYADSEEARVIEREESNNPNREWWERTYGEPPSAPPPAPTSVTPRDTAPPTP